MVTPYVTPFLSKDQLGGRKKCSANHYLARLVQYVYEELDNGNDRDRRGVAAMALITRSYSLFSLILVCLRVHSGYSSPI